jgi:hypothetical protein|eukprot:COSAG01_NODE_9476_length_2436_cov_1.876337_2_plen_147_part_00
MPLRFHISIISTRTGKHGGGGGAPALPLGWWCGATAHHSKCAQSVLLPPCAPSVIQAKARSPPRFGLPACLPATTPLHRTARTMHQLSARISSAYQLRSGSHAAGCQNAWIIFAICCVFGGGCFSGPPTPSARPPFAPSVVSAFQR